MKARVLFPIIVLCCAACQPCPPPQTGPTQTIYDQANNYIAGGQLAVSLAGFIFKAWLPHAAATVDKAKVQQTFDQVCTDILDALQLARTIVITAQEQGKKFDLTALFAQAEVAYQQLRKLLADFGIDIPPGLNLPTSMPKVSPAKHRVSVKDLPETLLPKGK